MKIIKKGVIESVTMESNSFIYSIRIEGDGKTYSPIYPYVRGETDFKNLEEFVRLYQKELLQFYKNGHNRDFSIFLFGVGGNMRQKFLDKWFKKGVMIT